MSSRTWRASSSGRRSTRRSVARTRIWRTGRWSSRSACSRDNGFETWVVSGGTQDFVRVIAEEMYGVPPQRVIGTTPDLEFVERDGEWVVWRAPELGSFNDKAEKPANIALHIGRRPALAAGNVRSGGDVAMLTYGDGRRGPSLRLMINHDDPEREFAYAEADNASLNAAALRGWTRGQRAG